MVDKEERKKNTDGCPAISLEVKNEIVKMYNEGHRKKDIAEEVKISYPSVLKIIKARS